LVLVARHTLQTCVCTQELANCVCFIILAMIVMVNVAVAVTTHARTHAHTHTHSVKALKAITVTLSDMSVCIYVCTALYHLSKKSACTYPAYFYILQS